MELGTKVHLGGGDSAAPDGFPVTCFFIEWENDQLELPLRVTLLPNRPFRSLRLRLLGAMILSACVAAVLVAIGSYWMGTRWAMSERKTRFDGIKKTLANANFPLNATVLGSLANLTQTELITLNQFGDVQYSTLPIGLSDRRSLGDERSIPALSDTLLSRDGNRYVVMHFDADRSHARADGVFRVAVLFDQQQINAGRRRAAILPLATGLSTILALSTITLLLSSRLVGRVGRLQRRVEAVAAGDFESTVSDHVADEIGRLGGAVDGMAGQLDQLWKQVNRQQSEKLLHQIAGGMAHQLRNSLTGARMAIELHAGDCPSNDDEGLAVAIHQIELSEDHVRRLLLVASGRQDQDRPRRVLDCWDDVRTSLQPLARHLKIDITWKRDESVADQTLQDGPTWGAAVTNLIHNAMEAGDQVMVQLDVTESKHVRVRVSDNGEGIQEAVSDEIFEAFVTSKPEGLGLGLAVVRRAADYLGGEVTWERRASQTVFEMSVQVLP